MITSPHASRIRHRIVAIERDLGDKEKVDSNNPAGGWFISAKRNEALHRLTALGGTMRLPRSHP